jgi:glycosyltransferase involved in cell wall biosynthesis
MQADSNRVRRVPLSVDPMFRPLPRKKALDHVRSRFGLEGPFVLHVGTLEPRKNHVALVSAYEQMRRAGFGGPLVLVGRDGWRVAPIHARLARSPVASAIVRLPGVSDNDLVALYNACTLFAFPSFDEGFGLPPLEAMACGAACITSRRSSLLEIAEGAAELIDPDDPDSLAAAMIEIWRSDERRQSLSAAGQARAALYDHETWVRTMFAIYDELLGTGRGVGCPTESSHQLR